MQQAGKSMAEPIYSSQLFSFLKQLAKHNDRDWFQQHKDQYEAEVREPSLQLIREIEKPLSRVAPFFPPVAKKVGGSLMRVHRDTRFSKDKTPYKTNVGIQFRHDAGGDVHAPGFYLHLEPQACFVGAGCWRPAGDALTAIRAAIDADAGRWKRVRDNKRLRQHFHWAGESLKTAPRGYAKDHPQIEDLRRKDFLVISELDDAVVTSVDLIDTIIERFQAARPMMRFLCTAVGVPY